MSRPTLKLVPASPAAPSRVEFDAVFDSYHKWVAAVAARLCGRNGDVEDIVQDVFFLCARKIDTIATMADSKAWLRTVTVRVVRKRLRRRKWMAWFRSSDDELADLPYRGLAPDERAILAGLYGALAKLPVDERLAWTLRNVEGASLDEVACSSHCSLATVKRRIAKAASALQKAGHVASEA